MNIHEYDRASRSEPLGPMARNSVPDEPTPDGMFAVASRLLERGALAATWRTATSTYANDLASFVAGVAIGAFRMGYWHSKLIEVRPAHTCLHCGHTTRHPDEVQCAYCALCDHTCTDADRGTRQIVTVSTELPPGAGWHDTVE